MVQLVVDRLLERQAADNGGKYPESIAVVLWGTDNIKTYGESLAQVRSKVDRGIHGKAHTELRKGSASEVQWGGPSMQGK